MPSEQATQIPRITEINHRYQIAGDPKLHLSECLLVFANDGDDPGDTSWAYCTCDDWSPDE